MHLDRVAARLQPGDEIGDLGVAQVGNVGLERQAQHQYPRGRGQPLGDTRGDEAAHGIVDAPPGQDHLGYVARLGRPVAR